MRTIIVNVYVRSCSINIFLWIMPTTKIFNWTNTYREKLAPFTLSLVRKKVSIVLRKENIFQLHSQHWVRNCLFIEQYWKKDFHIFKTRWREINFFIYFHFWLLNDSVRNSRFNWIKWHVVKLKNVKCFKTKGKYFFIAKKIIHFYDIN